MSYYDQVAEAAAFLKSKLGSLEPRVGMVLGSGLGAAAEAVADAVVIPYGEIPHFPQSTVEGHSGRMVAGSLGGAPVDRHAGARAFLRRLLAARRSRFPCACWARWDCARWC